MRRIRSLRSAQHVAPPPAGVSVKFHPNVDLYKLEEDLEALSGSIAAVVTMIRAFDRLEGSGDREALEVDWSALSLFADHLETLTNNTLHEYVFEAVRRAIAQADDGGVR